MGDPAGIGPEICIKAVRTLLIEDSLWSKRLELHGDPTVFADAGLDLKGGDVESKPASDLIFVDAKAHRSKFVTGQASAEAGEMAYQAIHSVLTGIRSGRLSGLVTAPINKKALNLAGHIYPGHTEILAEAAGGVPVRMMLANEELAVVLVTIHLPLKQAIEALSVKGIVETIRITDAHFRQFKRSPPNIAVAGLNPHAGEDGLLGFEEIDLISPAIRQCQAEGISVSGPYPPDTIFMEARRSRRFDVVVAQYHDQGLIPVKYLGVEQGVNVTLGLPFVRTSPDHGTAFDIAGKGIADPRSMIAAIRMAAAMLGGTDR